MYAFLLVNELALGLMKKGCPMDSLFDSDVVMGSGVILVTAFECILQGCKC